MCQWGACSTEVGTAPIADIRIFLEGRLVRLSEGKSLVSVLYRRGSQANVLFTTERCNSLCLMCSQPPRDASDDWRVAELRNLVPLIDKTDLQLGITGGEPTLLGEDLVQLLQACGSELPDTQLHVLTNGRRFADPLIARSMITAGGRRTTWAVPVYSDGPARHDEIVDSNGAFAETMSALAELASLGARVEIRVVLHALSVPRLVELTEFIYRRLPFVEHVALMGLEPMGFAKGNREILWIDPIDYVELLHGATRFLSDRGMAVSIYNLPLCVLPRSLWPYARQSIYDGRNFEPDDAVVAGFLDRVVAVDEIEGSIEAIASGMRALHAPSHTLAKMRLRHAAMTAIREAIDRELTLEAYRSGASSRSAVVRPQAAR